MRRVWTAVAGILLILSLSVVTVFGQEFQKTYNVQAGAVIRVENISGDIQVTGYSGSAVEVKGFKEGQDKDLIDVEDNSTAESVSLKVRYPHGSNTNASVRFELLVPRSTSYQFDRLSTASGDISVKDITGKLKIHSASGDVMADHVQGEVHVSTASGDLKISGIHGTVNASTASGDIELEIVKLEGPGQMKVSTASGDVNLGLPSDLDIEMDMSTVSGSMKTDFPIEIHTPEHGPGQSAHGRIGNGTFQLKATTVSGDINLRRI